MYTGVETTGAPGAGAPVGVKNYTWYKGTPSITLSCSARTDVLSCSLGTDGAEKDSLSFANKLLQFAASTFSCFVVYY